MDRRLRRKYDFENVQSLALMMAADKGDAVQWLSNLNWWQSYRSSRTDGVKELAPRIMRRRQGEQDGVADHSWLYNIDVAKDCASTVL